MKTVPDKLAQRLAEVEAEQNRLEALLELEKVDKKISISKGKASQLQEAAFSILALGQKTIGQPSISSHTQGYVVCLMLNPKSPPEWSGKEWHVQGKGKCYPNIEQAHQCLQQLKKRWPNYIFQLLER